MVVAAKIEQENLLSPDKLDFGSDELQELINPELSQENFGELVKNGITDQLVRNRAPHLITVS